MSRYRLVGRLESGELAELYKAVRDDGVTVTIKLFHEKTSDAAYARELAQTARILNPLAHTGILHFVEIGLYRKRLAVVRENAEGYSLGQGLQRLATKEVILPPAVALYIILELLEAVQRAHDVDCIHGAITPGNISLSLSGHAHISDFGALRALEASVALKAFLNKGRGTYRAPEVARGEGVTNESDIYSLGAIAYELLTLRELNPGKGISVRREAILPPSRLDRRVNSRLDPIIMRAVELVPGRRYRQCNEMVAAIRNFLSASGGMPSSEDVGKFVRELFPNEVKGDSMGPVPFAEEFEIAEIRGAEDLPDIDSDRSVAVEPRPAFSSEFNPAPGQLPGQPPDDEHGEISHSRRDTVAASPAFAEFKQPPTARPPKEEPRFEDGTNPGQAGPLEAGWDAPAASFQKGPKLRPMGQANQGATGAQSALKGRVRVVEDFAPLPTMSQEIEEQDARDAQTRDKLEPPKRKPTPPPAPAPKKSSNDSYGAEPGPSGPNSFNGLSATSGPQKLSTLERRIKGRALFQRKMVLAAGAIALIGLCSFAYAVWRFNKRKPRIQSNDAPISFPQTIDDQLTKKPLRTPPPVKKDDEPKQIAEDDRTASPIFEKQPAEVRRELGYLTISSNVAAYVYVDGTKLKTRTPLKRYPLTAGTRNIVVESVRTGEQKKFKLAIPKGKDVKIIETFDKKSGRR